MREYNLIDADAHVMEPPDFGERFPAKYKDRAPYLDKDTKGGDCWVLPNSGFPKMTIGLMVTPGQSFEDVSPTGISYDEIRPGVYDPTARIADMDLDGVDAAVLFPDPVMFMALSTAAPSDPEFYKLSMELYNDWVAEWVSADPSRLIGLANLPTLGVEAQMAELRRTAALGFRGVNLGGWPSGGAAPTEADDPFWQLCVDLEMPVNIHVGVPIIMGGATSEGEIVDEMDFDIAGLATGTLGGPPGLVSSLCFSGVFDRFPDLEVVVVEAGVGWVPYVLEQMDDRYWRNRTWANVKIPRLPSEYFRRNMAATFIVDRFGIANRHAIGVTNMMWSSDYPHHGNDWPYSRKTVEEMFFGVPDEERHAICAGNAAALYKLDR